MFRTIPVPDWLNESFVQTVLQHDSCMNKEVKVNSVEVTPAAAPGVNYVCILFRVHAKYQTEDDHDKGKDVSMIVKTIGNPEFMVNVVEGHTIKEYIVYKEFLPEMYKVLNTERFTAKLLYSPGPTTLVLEDLKDEGFVLPDRLKQLDFDQCLVCLKTLAKFHAASVAVVKKNPELIVKAGKEPMFNRLNVNDPVSQKFQEMWKNMAYLFTKTVETWEGFEDFEEKSRHVWETIMDDLCDAFEPRKDSLNVINHGDMWTNNVMFKYNSDGNIVDLRLLDFQQCRYGTPATDLTYLFFSSANRDVRENRLEELTSAYLETLNSVLEQVDCEERLTKEQLDAELKRCQCFILIVTQSLLSLSLVDPDDLVNLDGVTEEQITSMEGNLFAKAYQGKYYKEVAAQILHYLDKQGFFDKQRKET